MYFAQYTPPGGSSSGGLGTVTSVGLAGTANQITVTGSSPITGSGSWTLSLAALGSNGQALTSNGSGGFGTPFTPGTAATANTGTSGATVPLLSTANIWTLAQTFSAAPVFSVAVNLPASSTLNSVSFGTASTVNTGTSGATIPLLNGANTFSGITTHTAALLIAKAPAAANCTGSALANCGTLSVGGGPFDGSTTGKFVGSIGGTSIAVNEVSGYAGNLMDLQVVGTSRMNLSAAGTLTIPGGSGLVVVQHVQGIIALTLDTPANSGTVSIGAYLTVTTTAVVDSGPLNFNIERSSYSFCWAGIVWCDDSRGE